jgi:hypothetical protein
MQVPLCTELFHKDIVNRSWQQVKCSRNECEEIMQQNKLCCIKSAKIFAKTLALQCNKCYSVFSNKTEQLEITLKREEK